MMLKVSFLICLGTTSIMLAAKDGHQEVVKLLLEHGANIEEKDDYGKLV